MRYADRWYNRIPRDSKRSDLRKRRTNLDLNQLIDYEWCVGRQISQRNLCYYCDVFMNWWSRKQPNGLTVERLDSSKPHHKTNCVLSCYTCNMRRLDKDPVKKRLVMEKAQRNKLNEQQTKTICKRCPCFV